ncbi:porin [Paraburkholderia sp. HD33-4]|uniref:porin n=1 Tax=Paraburkholderia sp. HD33-4 TaxID=2883242 RepID=UPI001F1E0485|nr:porin [Paraburkholderia sp. HD33-4]
MKKQIALLSTVGLIAGVAHAQSSITLYGILDVGVNYVSNDNGHPNYTVSTVLQGDRWGFKGNEDLGGGLSAIFQLENGFSIANGGLAQGRMFARQSWVGINSTRFGSLTMGRQYDAIVDYIVPLPSSNWYIGVAHPFDNDNLISSWRLNNTIKYASPNIGGLTFGGLYAFSNTASTDSGSGFATNRAWSLGGNYQAGSWGVGAAYTQLSSPNSTTTGAVSGDYIDLSTKSALGVNGLTSPVLKQDILAAGTYYTFGSVKMAFVYTNTKFDTAGDTLKFSNYDLNVGYYIRPNLLLAGSYVFTDGKLDSTGAQPKYHQISALIDYFLSKRTDVYLLEVYQRAAGDATVASIAPDAYGQGGSAAPDASTSKSQLLVRVGLRHKF